MSDPRYDSSLDAPPAPVPTESETELEPNQESAAKSDHYMLSSWVLCVDVIPPESRLEVLTTDMTVDEAIELAGEACQDEQDGNLNVAAAIMLAGWRSPSLMLAPYERVHCVRARLHRDWIRIPVGHGKSIVRAEWLNETNTAGSDVSFLLDACVADGRDGIRRTWSGSYWRSKPKDEPWRGHPPREALWILLGVMSGTAGALALQLAASDVPSSLDNNVRANLRWFEKQNKVVKRKVGVGVMWSRVGF